MATVDPTPGAFAFLAEATERLVALLRSSLGDSESGGGRGRSNLLQLLNDLVDAIEADVHVGRAAFPTADAVDQVALIKRLRGLHASLRLIQSATPWLERRAR